jgi:hypothetical protein
MFNTFFVWYNFAMNPINWSDIKRMRNRCITCAYLFSNAQSRIDMVNMFHRNVIINIDKPPYGHIGVRELNCYKNLNDKMFHSFRSNIEVKEIREKISKAKCPFRIIPPFHGWQPYHEGTHPQIEFQQEQSTILIRLTSVLILFTVMLFITSIALLIC